jgi:predicted RNA binding protein YcfA (HicA-like mRNA interferase family)
MSPRLPRVTATELVRALERDGWEFSRQRGSHQILTHPKKPGRVIVPMHSGPLKVGLVSDTLSDAGLTPDDLRRLLR